MKEEENKKTELTDFLRYTKKEMTDLERNAFERELQKDPFAEEAADGLSGILPNDAESDIKKLRKKLKNRTSRNQRFIYLSIAASVAVLMIISSLLIFVGRNKPSVNFSQAVTNPVYLDIPASKPLEEPVTIESKANRSASEKTAAMINKPEIAATSREKILVNEKSIIARTDVKDTDFLVAEDRMAAPAQGISKPVMSVIKAKGKVISSEDNKPIPGVTVMIKGTDTGVVTDLDGNFSITLPDKRNQTLVADFIGMESKEFQAKADSEMEVKLDPSVSALSEVVVVGYGAKKSESLPSGYIPPQPVNGKKSFDNYVEENIRKPAALLNGERKVVVVAFRVLSSGDIDSIRVIRSPGNEFSDEAVRLIKEGPSWKPAEEDGKKIEDEVRVRIVFK